MVNLLLGKFSEQSNSYPLTSLTVCSEALTFSTATLKSIGPVVAFCSILAWRAGTLIYVNLTHSASKPWDIQTQR